MKYNGSSDRGVNGANNSLNYNKYQMENAKAMSEHSKPGYLLHEPNDLAKMQREAGRERSVMTPDLKAI